MKKLLLLIILTNVFTHAQVGINTISPTETFDNNGTARLRNLPLNGSSNAISTDPSGNHTTTPNQSFNATRTVVADANGVLGYVQQIPYQNTFFSSSLAGRQTTTLPPPAGGTSGFTTIIYPGEESDLSNSFNPSTGVFTVPSEGLYFFTASTQFDNSDPSTTSATPDFQRIGFAIERQRTVGGVPTTNIISQQFFHIITKVFASNINGSIYCLAGDRIYVKFSALTDLPNERYAVAASKFLGWKIQI